MNRGLSSRNLVFVAVLVGLAIAALETLVKRPADGTLLVTLTFWTGLVHGCIAVVAVGVLASGVWLNGIRRELLSFYPLLLFIAIVYLLMWSKIEIYPWSENPGKWLNPRFFILRNVVLHVITFWLARGLAREVLRNGEKQSLYAGLYATFFIVAQSFVAFDWIMTLEYPWVSTLLGGYFFAESFLMGLLSSALIVFFLTRRGATHLRETLRDTGNMMFGFCFMWGGFFFAQFLVIWYGNIPEEVAFLITRVSKPPYANMSWLVLAMIFIVPFIVLLSRPFKVRPVPMALLALVVFGGLLIEKLVLVLPVVPVNPPTMALEFIAMIALMAVLIRSRDTYLPPEALAASSSPEPGSPRPGPQE